jgi:hypothetical protein
MAWLVLNSRRTWCKFKGSATYFDLVVGERRAALAAWSYPDPTPPFAAVRHYLRLLRRSRRGVFRRRRTSAAAHLAHRRRLGIACPVNA